MFSVCLSSTLCLHQPCGGSPGLLVKQGLNIGNLDPLLSAAPRGSAEEVLGTAPNPGGIKRPVV